MAKVAHLPFPVSFLHVLPARPSRHTQLVETQLSTIKVRAQAWFPPLLEPAFKAACSPTLPQPGWQGCMFPSCLPLCFNAKVLAKDIFLLFLCFSILFCTVGLAPLPQLWAVSPGRAHSRLKAPGAHGGLGCSVSSWDLLRKVAYVL